MYIYTLIAGLFQAEKTRGEIKEIALLFCGSNRDYIAKIIDITADAKEGKDTITNLIAKYGKSHKQIYKLWKILGINVHSVLPSIVEDIKNGMPAIEIANIHGYSYSHIRRIAKANGVKLARKKTTTPIPLIIEDMKIDMHAGAIAKKHGYSIDHIRRIAKEHGITLKRKKRNAG